MNPYHTLGVEPTASPEEIKAAYRRKAKQHHPDKGGEGFEQIGKAYALLTDPAARTHYDRTGESEKGRLSPISLLTALFSEAIQQDVTQNIVNVVRTALHQGAEKLRKAQRGKKAELSRMEKLTGRVKTKPGTPNIVDLIIDERIALLHRDLAVIESEIALGAAALAILDDYTDDLPPVSEASARFLFINENFASQHAS